MARVGERTTVPSINTLSLYSKMKDRKVIYKGYETKIYCKGYDGVITGSMAKELLGYEIEKDYTERLLALHPGTKETKWKLGDNYLFKNANGEKVWCWNNTRNRPFEEKPHARGIAQTILTRSWEMNLENIVVGETGLILSGQHRLIGLLIAIEEWYLCKIRGDKGYWEQYWDEEPYIESIIAYGAKETMEVMRTYDNVKSRTLADTIYTSPIFEDISDQLSRQMCSKMLDAAIDCLWKRTRQVVSKNSWIRFQTVDRSFDLLDKHPRLKSCVKHLFKLNKHKILTLLGISPGQSAAMMYLMAASNSDHEVYHCIGSVKDETLLNMELYDTAVQFWNDIATEAKTEMNPVRKALRGVRDPYTGNSAGERAKQMILSRAWNKYAKGEEITESDLDLNSVLVWSESKQRTLVIEETVVGGIDCGVVKNGGELDEVVPTAEELEEERKKVGEARDAENKARLAKLEQRAEEVSKGNGGVPFTAEERAAELAKVRPTVNQAPSVVPKKLPPKRPTLK